MSVRDRLLDGIANEYQICRNSHEPVENFKARVIYSALCRQAYASLFDRTDEPTISIQHFKDRINELQRVYASIVQVNIGYLLPPPELNLIRLYIWAQTFIELSNNFNRTFETKIFAALKTIFERRGYRFEEE